LGERTIWGLDCESRSRALKRRGFAWQGGAVERECTWCLSEPRTVRFGCGHSLLCGGCLEDFLAANKPCVPFIPLGPFDFDISQHGPTTRPALHPRAEEDALMFSCHGTCGSVPWSGLTSDTSPVYVVYPVQTHGVVIWHGWIEDDTHLHSVKDCLPPSHSESPLVVLWCFVLNPHRRPRHPTLLWCDIGKLRMSSPAN
jgi:hypothetical protein